MKTIKIKNYTFKIVVDPNMRDYSKEPYFVKKLEDAKEFIRKNPPPSLSEKK